MLLRILFRYYFLFIQINFYINNQLTFSPSLYNFRSHFSNQLISSENSIVSSKIYLLQPVLF